METKRLSKTEKEKPATLKSMFRETIKTLKEKRLEEMKVLIEMELMERDRRS